MKIPKAIASHFVTPCRDKSGRSAPPPSPESRTLSQPIDRGSVVDISALFPCGGGPCRCLEDRDEILASLTQQAQGRSGGGPGSKKGVDNDNQRETADISLDGKGGKGGEDGEGMAENTRGSSGGDKGGDDDGLGGSARGSRRDSKQDGKRRDTKQDDGSKRRRSGSKDDGAGGAKRAKKKGANDDDDADSTGGGGKGKKGQDGGGQGAKGAKGGGGAQDDQAQGGGRRGSKYKGEGAPGEDEGIQTLMSPDLDQMAAIAPHMKDKLDALRKSGYGSEWESDKGKKGKRRGSRSPSVIAAEEAGLGAYRSRLDGGTVAEEDDANAAAGALAKRKKDAAMLSAEALRRRWKKKFKNWTGWDIGRLGQHKMDHLPTYPENVGLLSKAAEQFLAKPEIIRINELGVLDPRLKEFSDRRDPSKIDATRTSLPPIGSRFAIENIYTLDDIPPEDFTPVVKKYIDSVVLLQGDLQAEPEDDDVLEGLDPQIKDYIDNRYGKEHLKDYFKDMGTMWPLLKVEAIFPKRLPEPVIKSPEPQPKRESVMKKEKKGKKARKSLLPVPEPKIVPSHALKFYITRYINRKIQVFHNVSGCSPEGFGLYMQKHNIAAIFRMMMSSVLSTQPDHPLDTLISFMHDLATRQQVAYTSQVRKCRIGQRAVVREKDFPWPRGTFTLNTARGVRTLSVPRPRNPL